MWTPTKITAKNFTSLKTFEYDFRTGCTIVKAENRDDAGQESNGGGKSSFIDIVAVGLIGQSLSDRSLKECVNWDSKEPFFIVTLSLAHPELGDLYIERKVYNNTRPSELIILLNDEVPKGVPTKGSAIDIIPGNQYLLDMIGISKADLLSYYLVSGAYYIPYMKAPAKQKTEIINRFSKADKIDAAIDIAKSKALEQAGVYKAHQENLEQIQYSLSVLEAGIGDSKIQETGELEKEIEKHQPDLEKFDKSISKLKDDRQASLDKISEEIQGVRTQEDEALDGLSSQEEELELSTEADLEVFDDAIEEKKEKREEDMKASKEIRTYVAGADRDLAGKVECPKCSHEFNAVDPKKDLALVAALKAESEELLGQFIKAIEENEAEVETLVTEKNQLNRMINDQLQEISKEKRKISYKYNAEVSELSQRITETKRDFDDDIGQDTKAWNDLRLLIEGIESEIAAIKRSNDIMESHYKSREKLQAQLTQCEKDIKEWSEDNRYELWSGYFADFKFFLANKPIESLTQSINFYLSKNDSDLSVLIEGFVKLKNGEIRQKLNPLISRSGLNQQSYGSFSGGERARLDISCDLAFQEMINSASPTGGLNYYQNDELLNALDSKGIRNAASAFEMLGKPILLVTHAGNDLFYPETVTIIKENGQSKIE